MAIGEEKYDLIISKVEERTVTTKDVLNQTVYTLNLTDGVKITSVKITQPSSFDGFKPGDAVSLTIKRTQKTLDET